MVVHLSRLAWLGRGRVSLWGAAAAAAAAARAVTVRFTRLLSEKRERLARGLEGQKNATHKTPALYQFDKMPTVHVNVR